MKKSEFPLVVSVPVPEGGKTWVRVLFDNKVYYEYYQEEV
jgi:serine/threonine-protein kinase